MIDYDEHLDTLQAILDEYQWLSNTMKEKLLQEYPQWEALASTTDPKSEKEIALNIFGRDIVHSEDIYPQRTRALLKKLAAWKTEFETKYSPKDVAIHGRRQW